MVEQAVGARIGTSQTFAWVGFMAMCVGMFMAILDVQIVATSLPAVQAALDIRPDQISWIQTSYLIAEIIAIPLTGWLTRALSLRGLSVIATAVFTLASIGCALSFDLTSLIAARIVQGFAGGILIPVVFSGVFLLFPARQQSLATAIAGMLAVLAPTIGPIGGGWITSAASWHWLFLINTFPGLVTVLLGAVFLPVTTARTSEFRKFDLVSLVVLIVALAALEIGLKQAPNAGWVSAPVLALAGLAFVCGLFFVRRCATQARPLVDLSAFRDGRFALGCLMSFILGTGLYGMVYLMPVFLGFVRDHDAFAIGRIMLVTGMAQLISAPIVVWLETRVSALYLTAFGFMLFALGLGLSAFDTPRSDFAAMILPQFLRGFAVMFCILAPTRIALGHLPSERVPNASGLFNAMRNLGGAIGLALTDTIIYGRAEMHGRMLAARLLQRDDAAFAFTGLPKLAPKDEISPLMMALARPIVEKAGLTLAIADAWMMLAALAAIGGLLTFIVPTASRPRIGSLAGRKESGASEARTYTGS